MSVSECSSTGNVQVELLELLADIDYKFIVYLESVGLTSASAGNHRFLGVSCTVGLINENNILPVTKVLCGVIFLFSKVCVCTVEMHM